MTAAALPRECRFRSKQKRDQIGCRLGRPMKNKGGLSERLTEFASDFG
jgi:hypothetical protein